MKILAGLLIFLFFSINLFAQSAMDDCHRSTEGTDFWFGFMEGRDLTGVHYLEINVTARETTTFSVFYGPDETILVASRTVQPGVSEQITIPKDLLEPIGSEKIENKGIHLVSEKPVNVFALNWDRNSNDAAIIYPTKSLGTEYFAMCYTPSIPTENGRNSEFVVVASEDSTIIYITPTVETDQHRQAGITFPITLNKGQLFQVQSMNVNYPEQGDLTGTYISSDKPVALFSGCLIAIVPVNAQIGTGDHLFEQIPPVHAWGREFYTLGFTWRNRNRFRVLASEDNTVVSVYNYANDTLNKGGFEEYVIPSEALGRIYADKPILVAQYSMTSSEDVLPESGANLEPFMIILSPVEQMRNSANFVVYQAPLSTFNYFLVVITTAQQAQNITLDGNPINFITSGNEYSFATIEFNRGGVHDLRCSDQKGGFLAYEYSFGFNESNGYGVAFNLDPLLDLRESLDFGGDTLLLCNGSPKTLDAGPYFEKYEWNTGETTQKITISEGGDYSVKVTDKNGCSQSDSVFVYLSSPLIELGIKDTASCAPFSLLLDAGTGFNSYLWSTGETIQKITANKTNLYSITISDKYGCEASDSVQLTVYPIPEIKYNGTHLICGDRTALIQLEITGADPSLWAGLTNWDTDKKDLLSFSDITDTSVKVTVKEWGDYRIFFNLSTTNGCDTTKQFDISFYETPTSDFIFPGDSVNDKCGAYSREVLYIGTGSEKAYYNWDFGSSQIVDTLGFQHFRISLGFGSNPEIKLVVEEHGCFSSQFKKEIAAIPNFNVSANPLTGCDNIEVSFSANLLLEEDVNYLWNFGGNVTSDQSNADHLYSGAGFYDVGLTVENKTNKCKAAFKFKDMIKVYPTPVANFSFNSYECHDDSLDIIYLNNNDSSICTWDFQGAHQSGYGNDSIKIVIDSSMAYIYLTVEEFGCKSKTATKNVYRKPHIDFTIDEAEGCQPMKIEAIGNSPDKDIIYTWMLNGESVARGKTYQYFFPDSGLYNIGLSGYSNITKCRDTIQKSDLVWVHPKPSAEFEVDHPIAYIEHSLISFINNSSFATYYFWDFDDGNTSNLKNPKNNYGRSGIFNSLLITESEYGCLDTASLQINIIPFTVFTPNAFRPDSEVPENKYFMPVGQGIDPDRFNIKFFDRWGQLIFESFNMADKWDGKTRNGQQAPMGNYVWSAVYYDILGFEHHQKGQVLLIR